MSQTHANEGGAALNNRTTESSSGSGAPLDLVVLAGCIGAEPAWTGGLQRILLPLPRTTLIGSLIQKLGESCTGTVTICTNTAPDVLASQGQIRLSREGALAYRQDPVPVGTAGCIRACSSRVKSEAFLVVAGSLWFEGDLDELLAQHRAQKNALTIGCTPDRSGATASERAELRPVSVYCCDPAVLKYIPETGYFDLKEQLVPALLAADLRVGAVVLGPQTREVVDWPTYLHAVERSFSAENLDTTGLSELSPGVWCGPGVEAAPNARVVGPVYIGQASRIGNDAVVVGPAILGDRTHVGPGSGLHRIIASPGTRFPKGATLVDRYVFPDATEGVADVHEADRARVRDQVDAASHERESSRAQETGVGAKAAAWIWGYGFALAGLFVWAFWHTFAGLWNIWDNSGEYSIGLIVPAAAIYMIASRQGFGGHKLHCAGAGIAVFAVGLATSLVGNRFLFGSLENVGMVICANGLVLSMIGWSGYRRLWYPMVFLLLMIPLPGRVHDAVMLPLQGFSTQVSAAVLEVIGVPAVQMGNVLEVGGRQVAVAEACNGLRMALAFLLVAGVIAYVVQRPRWQRVLVLLSSLPIALICNIIRIVVTTYLFHVGYEGVTKGAWHDLMGLLMMPAALGMILLELWILPKLALSRHRGGYRAVAAGR